MKTVKFYTLGCKVNLYETEAIKNLFKNEGFLPTDSEVADIYVINTCTVTAAGDKKSRQIIHRAKRNNPDGIVAVIGCYAQVSADEIQKISDVDIIVGTAEKSKVVDFVKQFCGEKINALHELDDVRFEEMSSGMQQRTRAMLKIQDGCENFCSYCIIPYARGRLRSRSIKSSVLEAESLAAKGFTEVVLVGIHLSSYGKRNNLSLIDVIKEICNVEGIIRVRIGSLEPKIITKSFVRELSALKKVCPSFHISMQSGCDETLKRMNRKYTVAEYLNALALLREYFPNCAVSTDVMVGFPGESDIEFEKTIETINKAQFSQMHVFAYSRRKGTPADTMKNQIDDATKAKRSKELIALGESLRKNYLEKFIGKRLTVLFETTTQGFTDNYIRVVTKEKAPIGSYQDVIIETCNNNTCIGKIAEEKNR
ncbi:MAG: tRNA (N(6)-L-threonylcarbamoyladenosine(37)-C(2))-methylthiotransferase MtaB [Firmicutes bacterium]|nr:tRNA (N(6)-L-threonylcarbamoyladenosine(37)-C(2))-methylthiotransferase MtaB [Bacillota bacterium]